MSTSSEKDYHRERLEKALTKIAHDISNPLSVIVGNTQLLLELTKMIEIDHDLTDPLKDIEKAAERIEQQVARLKKVQEDEFGVE